MITPWAQLAEEDHFMPIHPMKDSVSEIYSLIKDANMGAPQLVLRRLALCLVRAGLVPEKIGEQLQWEGKGFSALSVNVETPTHIQFIDLSRTSQNYYTFCHGTSWEGAVSILGEGILALSRTAPFMGRERLDGCRTITSRTASDAVMRPRKGKMMP